MWLQKVTFGLIGGTNGPNFGDGVYKADDTKLDRPVALKFKR